MRKQKHFVYIYKNYTMFQVWIFVFSIIYSFKFVSSAVQCHQQNVTVELPSSLSVSPVPYSIATWLCWKQGTQLDANKVVHLTIHGYTYDHNYWLFPYQLPNYSYVDYVIDNSNGSIIVLNIDRTGIGLSSKPLIALGVTIDANANVIYQLKKVLYQGTFENI